MSNSLKKTIQRYPFFDSDDILHIRYQDKYVFGTKILGMDDVKINSFVTGTDIPDEALFQINFEENSVFATGCGSATVKLDGGKDQMVIVEPSAINLFFVSGQSNAAGDPTWRSVDMPNYPAHFARSDDTMAMFTFTHQSLDVSGAEVFIPADDPTRKYILTHPKDYIVTNLKWKDETRYSGKKEGFSLNIFDRSSNEPTNNAGICAGLAHCWTEKTGERVWIVNSSHGGHPLNNFIPLRMGGPELIYNDYEQAVATFNLAIQTVIAEENAGHFKLNHMAYYWCQGEADHVSDEKYYLDGFEKVHRGFMEDVVYENNGVRKTLEYCGIFTVRSIRDSSGNSARELYMNGPRVAQYDMGCRSEGIFSNVYILSNVNEIWTCDDQNVVDYFLETYGSAQAFESEFGYSMPTTMTELHPMIHFTMEGHNEVGMDTARNSIYLINKLCPDNKYDVEFKEKPVNVDIVGVDGYTSLADGDTIVFTNGYCYLCPKVTPVTCTYDGVRMVCESEGAKFESFRLISDDSKPKTVTVSLYVGNEKKLTRSYNAEYTTAEGEEYRRRHHEYGNSFNPPRAVVYDD